MWHGYPRQCPTVSRWCYLRELCVQFLCLLPQTHPAGQTVAASEKIQVGCMESCWHSLKADEEMLQTQIQGGEKTPQWVHFCFQKVSKGERKEKSTKRRASEVGRGAALDSPLTANRAPCAVGTGDLYTKINSFSASSPESLDLPPWRPSLLDDHCFCSWYSWGCWPQLLLETETEREGGHYNWGTRYSQWPDQ